MAFNQFDKKNESQDNQPKLGERNKKKNTNWYTTNGI